VKATSNIVRVVFLVVAIFSYTQTTQAAEWRLYCNSYCSGYVRINDCQFWDDDFGGYYDTCTEAEAFFENLCEQSAWPYYAWGGIYNCDENGGNPAGMYYCSYEDPECGP
jgi:hypothetical protein